MESEIPKLPRRQGWKAHAGVDTVCEEKQDPRKDYVHPRGHKESTTTTKAIGNVLVRGTPASINPMVALCMSPGGEMVTQVSVSDPFELIFVNG